MNARRLLCLIAFSLVVLLGPLVPGPGAFAAPATDAQRPELAYLKQVNEWRPPSDPLLLLLLMGEFANAGRHEEGIEYFKATYERFSPALDDNWKALYLVAIASLRAGHAEQVPLLQRIGWVRETVRLLDEAKRLTGGRMFVARWMSGVVRAQLPAILREGDAAIADLRWCVEQSQQAPNVGWLREVYRQLARLHRARGDTAQAQRNQDLSGLGAADERQKAVIFTTPFAGTSASGHLFSERRIREVVPGVVFALSGFEFTEFYFVVSADRHELIGIDAGTRPDSARAAHEALIAQFPSLPPLTTVLITHAHWDHVGGHRYFRSLKPAVRFIGRANFSEELANDGAGNLAVLQRFFGKGFRSRRFWTIGPTLQ
jgi:tetratricopeptide (TPR) repeat protein